MLLAAALLLVLLPLWSFVPGFFLVRRLRARPVEKLVLAVGASLLLTYLVSFTIYLFDGGPLWNWTATCVCLAALLPCLGDLRRLWPRVRGVMAGFAVLLVWSLGWLALVRNYSGGGWYGDWAEHFQRAGFFLKHLPVQTVLLGGYLVPARPPLANLVAAHFLAHVGARFELFQLASTFVNALAVLPCFLLAPMLGGRRRGVLVALLAFSPYVLQNVTYTWTKMPATFFVLLGVAVYLAGLRRPGTWRIPAAFAALAAGFLAHYSAGPSLVFCAAHYLIAVLPRQRRWHELGAAAISGVAVLSTWFSWSLATYGLAGTLATNTSVAYSSHFSLAGNVGKILLNIADTLVPYPLRHVGLAYVQQASAVGLLRDAAFLAYQCDLLPAIGITGGIVTLLLLARMLLARRPRPREATFLLALAGVAIPLGIAVVGERDYFGLAHICLAPIVLLTITWLASSLPRLPASLRWTLAAGAAVDLVLGIALHFHVQSVVEAPASGWALSRVAADNLALKRTLGLEFVGDGLAAYATAIRAALALLAVALLWVLVRAAARPSHASGGGLAPPETGC